MMNKKVLNLLGMAFLGCTMYAQEKTQDSIIVEQLETVVLDTKFKLDREKSGKVIYKISQKDLEKVQGQSLSQTINTVSGIEITGAKSAQGSVLSYRVRGGKNNQVVILIDGIQVNDPSRLSSDFDLNLLDVNNIENIEIIKGGVSTLYGTGATTAVINITTKKATDKKITGVVFMSTGSNRAVITDKYKLNAANVGANINGSLDKFTYYAGVSSEYTKGISAAKSLDDTIDFEDDPFKRENANVRLGYNFSKKFNLGTFVNYNKVSNDFDGGALAEANNDVDTENIQIGLSSEYKFNKGSVVLNTSLNKNNLERLIGSTTEYEGNSMVADLYSKYKFTNKLWVVAGVNLQAIEMFKSAGQWEAAVNLDDTKETIIDPYVNITYLTDFGLTLNGGARLNNHSIYGSHFVYSLNPSYLFEVNDKLDVKVFATGSTAFIAPTLYQKYSPNYGNEDLDPQESMNGEAGFELNYNKKYRFSAVAFHREDENLIDWSPAGYINFEDDNIKTQGVELEAKMAIIKNLNFMANYTFTQLDKEVSDIRLPKHKANVNISYLLKEKTNLTLAYQYTDKRNDIYFTPSWTTEDKVLDAYSLVNFFVSHQLTDNLELNGSLFNMFDEEYEEAFGFSTLGRNYQLGLKLMF